MGGSNQSSSSSEIIAVTFTLSSRSSSVSGGFPPSGFFTLSLRKMAGSPLQRPVRPRRHRKLTANGEPIWAPVLTAPMSTPNSRVLVQMAAAGNYFCFGAVSASERILNATRRRTASPRARSPRCWTKLSLPLARLRLRHSHHPSCFPARSPARR